MLCVRDPPFPRTCKTTRCNLKLTMLPQKLKAAGYTTHQIGKWCDLAHVACYPMLPRTTVHHAHFRAARPR